MNATIKDAPAFDFYPERWIAGTRHMTKTERSDYLELLCIQWLEDGLPDDLDRMARIVGHKHAGQLSPQVMEKFPSATDGKRRNRRMETEREKQRERIATAKEKSKKMHAARYEKQRLEAAANIAASSPQAVLEGCPPPTSHHPPLSNEQVISRGRVIPPGYPETEEQARSMATAAGVPPDYAATLWHDAEGLGGKDKLGNSVANFGSWVKGCWNRKQEADLGKRPPGRAANGAAKSIVPSVKTDNWGQAPIQAKNL
jgi:uncharacterized protein YdaU (DUF1376 family)